MTGIDSSSLICGFVTRGLMSDSFPQTDGKIEVRGLSGPVEVIRDRWGIPHIRAQAVAATLKPFLALSRNPHERRAQLDRESVNKTPAASKRESGGVRSWP